MRDLLMIPGPVEFEPEVLQALGAPTLGHTDPAFIAIFGRALKRLREVCLAPGAQPFVVAGSGTLAMELAGANLVEPGDAALVVNTGYFSDRMAKILERHGAKVTHVRAPPGDAPSVDEVETHLARGGFKVLAITHVDTSTGVLTPVEALVKAARKHGVLSVVDGVCATAGESFHQDAWGADVYLTASQKAVGVPPGLALLTVGPRALETWRKRKAPVASVYSDWAEWLPIMEAYEAGKPAYFATPPVNLVCALDVSLGQILAEGMEARFARHQRMARAFRAAWKALGLRMLPVSDAVAAHTLSAVYYPDGVDAALVGRVKGQGIVVAGRPP
ncbi:pyridoxal-phosphate-dependent aminotransferase family protein, partial [Pyxidicoccus sp. 3LG]